MPEPAARKEIDKEAEDHIALGQLLRKDRPEWKREAVRRIVATGLSVPQKIEKIREVDDGEEESQVAQIVRQASAQAARRRVALLSRAVKEPPAQESYVSYLFRERAKIRAFASRARVLTVGVFPPGLRPDPALRAFLVEQVQSAAISLSPRLELVAQHGWLHLTPAQYNEVMLLRRLAARLVGFDFAHLDMRDRNVIDRLQRVEGLFLLIHYRPEAPDSIVRSLRLACQKQGLEEKETDEAAGLALRILDAASPFPSLANCIVGLNILRSRRSLTLADLMRKGLGEVVSARDFDCDEGVRARIDQYVAEAMEPIRALQDQLQETRRLASYVSRREDGTLEVAAVRTIYNADEKEKYDFRADQENLTIFARRLLRRFDRTFASLLNGQVVLDTQEKVAVFSRSFFQLEFSRLRTVAEKLEKGPFAFNSFPLSRYLQMKDGRRGAIGHEVEARQLIEEGMACLVDLGKTLSLVLAQRLPAAGKTGLEPLEQVILKGKPFSLPGEGSRLVVRTVLENMAVEAALAAAVSYCFTAGMLLHDQFLYAFVEREAKCRADLAERILLVENLIDPQVFLELRALSGRAGKPRQAPAPAPAG